MLIKNKINSKTKGLCGVKYKKHLILNFVVNYININDIHSINNGFLVLCPYSLYP